VFSFLARRQAMSSVGAISSGYNDYSSYSTITGGGKITKASEDAAGLAIQEKTESQVRGLDQGAENLKDGESLLKIEDGALDQVTDYLQSIKELSVKAMNGTMSDDDKQSIQAQIKEYMQGIEDIAGNTTFNEKQLLNGDDKLSIATDGNGGEKQVSTTDSTLKALGIENYDVTKDFDVADIDKALEKVTSSRTEVGAQTSGVDYALTYNSHAALELNGYQMDKEESNSIEAYQKMKTQQVLDTYQNTPQKMQMEDDAQKKLSVFM
jgi:flagellin